MSPGDQHIITDATKDTRELRVGRSQLITDAIYLEHRLRVGTVEPSEIDGMALTGDPIHLDRAGALRLFALLGAFIHGWEPDDEG